MSVLKIVANQEKCSADFLAKSLIMRRLTPDSAQVGLERAGLRPLRPQWLHASESRPESGQLLGLASEAAWSGFFVDQVPALREAGWIIECQADFRHRVLAVSGWNAELEEDGNGWFSLSLGIDGRRLELAPLLHQLFHRAALA